MNIKTKIIIVIVPFFLTKAKERSFSTVAKIMRAISFGLMKYFNYSVLDQANLISKNRL